VTDRIIPSENKGDLTSFLLVSLLFLSLSLLLIYCFLISLLTLEEMASVFPHLGQYWPQIYHIYPLLCWDIVLLFLVSSGLLSWRDVKFHQRLFLASILRIMWFLTFILFMYCIMCIDLLMLTHSFFPGMKPTWSGCMIFLMCCWILCASISLRVFLFSSNRLVYNFLFVLCLYPVWIYGQFWLQ
jgi:hypothetical protein